MNHCRHQRSPRRHSCLITFIHDAVREVLAALLLSPFLNQLLRSLAERCKCVNVCVCSPVQSGRAILLPLKKLGSYRWTRWPFSGHLSPCHARAGSCFLLTTFCVLFAAARSQVATCQAPQPLYCNVHVYCTLASREMILLVLRTPGRLLQARAPAGWRPPRWRRSCGVPCRPPCPT